MDTVSPSLSFEEELVSHIPMLTAFARSLAPSGKNLPEDLVQQTMLYALKKKDSFTPGTNMKAWLCTILRNYFYSQLSKQKWEGDWDDDFADSLHFSTPGPDRETIGREAFQRFLRCFRCLNQDQRDVVVAMGYLELSVAESAKRLQVTEGTIKSRLSRARARLAFLMENGSMMELQEGGDYTPPTNVPPEHPYFPIAEALKELYAEYEEMALDGRPPSVDWYEEENLADLMGSDAEI